MSEVMLEHTNSNPFPTDLIFMFKIRRFYLTVSTVVGKDQKVQHTGLLTVTLKVMQLLCKTLPNLKKTTLACC
jgi:hypothetical protein